MGLIDWLIAKLTGPYLDWPPLFRAVVPSTVLVIAMMLILGQCAV